MKKLLFAVVFASFLASACSSGPVNYPVAGEVILDGNPVGGKEDAVIRFETTDKKGNTAESFVSEGKYLVNLTEGNYKVSLTWSKKTGKILKSKIAGPGQESEEVIQMIPVKYGAQSDLKVDISAKNLRKDFDLKSK
ncbi:MAG: hypothetical protein EXS07_10500 [Gemmataceae bacterium]|nr:hypothetical protein [Gemmataceae bacterium]